MEAIEKHDFKASSLFMYVAFQAVHDPFADSDVTFGSGIPKDYLDDARYAYIVKNVEGQINQEYYKSLALMDSAVENIYFALDGKGVLDNTYIIFASDNGGCPASGGKNTPLRGAKGSLFEGGVKVGLAPHPPPPHTHTHTPPTHHIASGDPRVSLPDGCRVTCDVWCRWTRSSTAACWSPRWWGPCTTTSSTSRTGSPRCST